MNEKKTTTTPQIKEEKKASPQPAGSLYTVPEPITSIPVGPASDAPPSPIAPDQVQKKEVDA